MNPLKTPAGTLIAGIVLAMVMTLLLSSGQGGNPISFTLWLHAVVGVMWIGLLYYFNFVQMSAVAHALAEGEPGPAAINRYVAPRALLYFRWAAVLTWLTGAAALAKLGIFVEAFTLAESARIIGAGAWLGTIMLFNVWLLIWPNQQKILGMKTASPEEIARAKAVAMMASRTNVMLSIPMLLAMTASPIHPGGLPF